MADIVNLAYALEAAINFLLLSKIFSFPPHDYK